MIGKVVFWFADNAGTWEIVGESGKDKAYWVLKPLSPVMRNQKNTKFPKSSFSQNFIVIENKKQRLKKPKLP